MKVVIDSQAFLIQSYGGVSRYFTRLAQHLAEQECNVRIVAPYHQNEYLREAPESLVSGRFAGKMSKWQRQYFGWRNRSISAPILQQGDFDVLHESYYLSRGSKLPNGRPTVLTVYDMIHELYPSLSPGHRIESANKRRAVERADYVICISECTRRDLVRLFDIDPEKTGVVHLGVDDPIAQDVESTSDQALDFPYVLYVGQRGGYKNFSSVVDAFSTSDKLARDFGIVAFGGGELSRRERSDLANANVGRGRVKQLSGGDRMLAKLYRNASAVIYPSKYEGFGMIPLEAMSYGCPAIVSNAGPMVEVNGTAAEYFDPDDVASIVHALENVLYSQERTAELRRLGEEHRKNFTWSKCASDTIRQYHLAIHQAACSE